MKTVMLSQIGAGVCLAHPHAEIGRTPGRDDKWTYRITEVPDDVQTSKVVQLFTQSMVRGQRYEIRFSELGEGRMIFDLQAQLWKLDPDGNTEPEKIAGPLRGPQEARSVIREAGPGMYSYVVPDEYTVKVRHQEGAVEAWSQWKQVWEPFR